MSSHAVEKKWIGAFGIGIGIGAAALDFSIVNTAIPTIQENFAATMSELQWIMAGLGAAMTALLVTMGRLADIFGRKRIFLGGQTLFALASLLCGFAPAMIWLIIGRILQGVSMAALIPVSLSLMVHQFLASEKGRAIGFWATITGVGLALGPVIGGLLVSFATWRWIFFINIPIMAISISMILKTVPESLDETHKAKLDGLGLALLILTTGSLALAIVEGPIWGWVSVASLSLFGVTLISGTTLVLSERKVAAPILPFGLFLNRTFVICTSCNFSLVFCWWGVFFFIPLYLDNIQGLAAYQMGLALLAMSVPYAAISLFIGDFAAKTGPKQWLLFGFALCTLSAIAMSQFSSLTPLWTILTALAVTGIGFGCVWSPSATFALSTLPKRLAGTASGAFTTVQEFGGTLGIAVAGTLFRVIDQLTVFSGLKKGGIELSQQDQTTIRGLLSDPNAIREHIAGLQDTTPGKFLPLFQKGFLSGFSSAMILLAAIGGCAFLLILFAMKRGKHALAHPEDT